MGRRSRRMYAFGLLDSQRLEPEEVDRDTLRLGAGAYVAVCVLVLAWAISLVFLPWYSLITTAGFIVFALVRVLTRQAISITFEPTGIRLGLPFREKVIRTPVAEFNGSRFRRVTVCDLRTAKTYDLTGPLGTRRLSEVAERHGYPIVRRTKPAFG